MKINIETIPVNEHPYPTVGNYWMDEDGVIQIRVADMGNEFYEGAVAVHELIEFLLCRKAGVEEKTITDFDIEFEKNYGGSDMEPGFAFDAPYKKQHTFATSVEMGMFGIAEEDWLEYELKLNSLFNEPERKG